MLRPVVVRRRGRARSRKKEVVVLGVYEHGHPGLAREACAPPDQVVLNGYLVVTSALSISIGLPTAVAAATGHSGSSGFGTWAGMDGSDVAGQGGVLEVAGEPRVRRSDGRADRRVQRLPPTARVPIRPNGRAIGSGR